MKKHVALLKSFFSRQGGLEKYAFRIADAFVKKGAKVSILTTSKSALLQQEPFSFYQTKTSSWPPFVRLEQFDRFTSRWIEEHKPDLVFGMDRNRFQTHIRAGNGAHAAYLKSRFFTDSFLKAHFCKFNPLHRKILKLEKEAFENPSLQKLFTNSHMVKKQILELYQVDEKKIEVIHNGVEWHEMEQDFNSWEEKKQTLFHFLFIGNGYSRKGLDRLLFALSLIQEKPFRLSVIGKDRHLEKYKKMAIQLGLAHKIEFLGPLKNLRALYQGADCLVIPSFYDPFANVTVEALAMGLFVISSKYNGAHEILGKENGSVIEDLLSPDSFVQELLKAMDRPKTKKSASLIRESVKHLDFSKQLSILMEAC